jgi:transposase
LAQLRHKCIQASEEEVVRSLEGHWREDVLFELKQVMEGYDFYQQQMAECDQELQKYLAVLPDGKRESEVEVVDTVPAAETKKGRRGQGERKGKSRRKNQPGFELGGELQRVFGVDLTRIDGIDVMTGQVILSEIGPDLSGFPNEDHFASWLELVPRRNITGGKVINQKSRESKNRVANALRMAAEALSRSDSYLGARYRRLRGRMEGEKAVKAMARYLACLVYRLVTKGQDYVDRGVAYFEKKRSQRELIGLKRKAAELGMQLVPVP